jgi:hypothetical protein
MEQCSIPLCWHVIASGGKLFLACRIAMGRIIGSENLRLQPFLRKG